MDLGLFDSAEGAARRFDVEARKLGRSLNFPDDDPTISAAKAEASAISDAEGEKTGRHAFGDGDDGDNDGDDEGDDDMDIDCGNVGSIELLRHQDRVRDDARWPRGRTLGPWQRPRGAGPRPRGHRRRRGRRGQ